MELCRWIASLWQSSSNRARQTCVCEAASGCRHHRGTVLAFVSLFCLGTDYLDITACWDCKMSRWASQKRHWEKAQVANCTNCPSVTLNLWAPYSRISFISELSYSFSEWPKLRFLSPALEMTKTGKRSLSKLEIVRTTFAILYTNVLEHRIILTVYVSFFYFWQICNVNCLDDSEGMGSSSRYNTNAKVSILKGWLSISKCVWDDK